MPLAKIQVRHLSHSLEYIVPPVATLVGTILCSKPSQANATVSYHQLSPGLSSHEMGFCHPLVNAKRRNRKSRDMRVLFNCHISDPQHIPLLSEQSLLLFFYVLHITKNCLRSIVADHV